LYFLFLYFLNNNMYYALPCLRHIHF